MATGSEEAKLELFLQWLQVNGAQLRGCSIKCCSSRKRFGIFSSDDVPGGVLLVVPLNLAITPMRVLEDPLFGFECRSLFEEGEVDDRFLMMLFLTVERLRKNSSWKPYLDMLPTEFENPLWFTDDELNELKGTTLHRATELQKKNLRSLFDGKVKKLAEKLLALDGNTDRCMSSVNLCMLDLPPPIGLPFLLRDLSYSVVGIISVLLHLWKIFEVRFEDFLWANSIFWTRALNIPLPHSFVFPGAQTEEDGMTSIAAGASTNYASTQELFNGEYGKALEINESASQVPEVGHASHGGDTIWVEGLVPGIDFCNHDSKAAATWEVDGDGSTTGVPFSMYLLSAGNVQAEKEISISYGNKGNEELLYLYGFVIENNPDDYLMIHYPMEAIPDLPFSETKVQLLEAQKGELRSLLPRKLLDHGFFPESAPREGTSTNISDNRGFSYSWSGQRKIPSYINNLVFPDDFLTALRTITMKENDIARVSSLLEELIGSEGVRQPSETEVRMAAWEACGDSGALQLLVDLLNMKMMELEEGSGTEENDALLLHDSQISDNEERSCKNGPACRQMSRNKRASIIYRKGQKELARRFVKEAEHALQLTMSQCH